jgi:FixJ family two-component response regulator
MSLPAMTWTLKSDTPTSSVIEKFSGKAKEKTDPVKETKPLMVCIIDNDAAIRDSLCFLIESEHIPVATFASAREFLDHWNPERTGCLLLDIRMPGMSGLELQAELSRQKSRVPLIMITGFGDVQMAVQAMKKGAFDFFEKPIHHQLLLDRLHQALDMETAAREEARLRAEFQQRYSSLTPTQKHVLDLVVDGKTSHEIGEVLGCKPKTVEVHRKNIYAKLGCKNVAAAIRMVMQQRITDEDE